MALDPRLIKITIDVNGQKKVFSQLDIKATGTKYANPLQNEAEVIISNLDKKTQDYILTETSPFNLNPTPKSILIEAGRQSYGTSIIYQGNIVSSNIGQPPDIPLTLKCLTGNFEKGNILGRGQPTNVELFQICKQAAQDLKTRLTFQAADKFIKNFTFNGSGIKQLTDIAVAGGVTVYIDNGALIVKDIGVPLKNAITNVSADTGMVGVPELTEVGIKVKYLLDKDTRLGGQLNLTSKINPASNGSYVIYKLNFDIATREQPFYYIAEAARIGETL